MNKYSLVIPCFNEEKNLLLLIERACEVFSGRRDIELILVDNGSTDKSFEIMTHAALINEYLVIERVEKNQGYGHGILSGLKKATGDFIGWTHADMQTDLADVLAAIELIESAGVKKLFSKGRRIKRPLADNIFTIGMSIFETTLLKKKLWDINAQPTFFDKDFFLDHFDNAPKDFSLDLFAYYVALKTNRPIFRHPVTFGERAHGHSHWNIDFSSKLKFIKRTLAYSFNLKRQLSK